MKNGVRYVVLVRPRGPGPDYWPKVEPFPTVFVEGELGGAAVQFEWQTVNATGGFTKGFDRSSAVAGDVELGERVDAWFEAHDDDPWAWELCQIRLPD